MRDDQADMAATANGPPPSRLQRARHAAADEFRRYVVSFLYLWVLLGVFTLHQDMVLRAHDMQLLPHAWAFVNALVLAKVMLIAEALQLGSRIKPEPLIYPIVIEAFILAVLFIAVHVLEHIITGAIHGDALAASIPLIGGGGMLGLMLAAFSFFVAMIPFCGFRQVARAIGAERMRAMLFGA